MDNRMRTLNERFSIQHSTLQVEQGTINHACALCIQPQRLRTFTEVDDDN